MARRNSNTDITKTGAMSWRDLQEMNGTPRISQEELEERLNAKNLLSSRQAALVNLNSLSLEDTPVKSPILESSEKDYFGNSVFDPDIVEGIADWERLSDIRAENQPWYSKLINGIGKGIVLAGTTFVEGVLALPVGIISGIAQKSLDPLWDNPVNRALKAVNDFAEEEMPNYYTQDEKENPFGNIFTANTLADKLLKNIGFMVGAFYGGLPLSKGVGWVGKTVVKGARAAQVAERTGMAKRVAELTAEYGDDAAGLTKALQLEHLTEAERGQRALNSMKRVSQIAKTTRSTSMVLGSTYSALSEGAIEAINNSEDWAKTQKMEAEEEHQKKLAEIDARYGGDENASLADKVKEEDRYQKKLQLIEENKTKVGTADLLWNIPILMASNMFELGKLYTRGFESSRRAMGNFWNGHTLKSSLKEGTLTTNKSVPGAILTSLAKSNAEGMEEFLQKTAADGSGIAVSEAIDRFLDSGSEGSKVEVDNYIAGFGKALAANLKDPAAWEEYMIGAVSASLGMPVFGSQTKNAYLGKGKAVGLSGGVVGSYQDYMNARKNELLVAEHLNKRVKDPKTAALYETLIKNGDLDALIAGTLSDEDMAKYKELEFEKLFNDINAAASSGHLAEFKELVGFNRDYSDEELADIVKTTRRPVSAEQQKESDVARKEYLEARANELRKHVAKGINAEINEKKAERLEKEAEELQKKIDENKYEEKLEGPFVMQGPNGRPIDMNVNDVGKQKMREKLEENRKHLLQSIDDYIKVRNDIDIESDGRLEDKDIALLTMMRCKILDYDRRSAEMADDVVNNLKPALSSYGLWNKKITDEYEEAKEKLDNAKEKLKEAKEKGVSVDEEAKLQKAVNKAESIFKNREKAYKEVTHAVELLESFTAEKDSNAVERFAYSRGLGENFFRSLASMFNFKGKRNPNTEELEAYFAHPFYMTQLMSLAVSPISGIDEDVQERLVNEIHDLHILATEKLEYNKKIREFLKDPNLLNDIKKNHQDKMTQKQKDNKSEELSLSLKTAKNFEELDSLWGDALQTNYEIGKMAFEKAKKTANESQKKMLEDYEKAVKLHDEVVSMIDSLPGEIGGGLQSSLNSAWERSLYQNKDLYNDFLTNLEGVVAALKETGLAHAKKQADALEKILSDLNAAASSVATNSNDTGSSSSDTDTDDDTSGGEETQDSTDLAALTANTKRKIKKSTSLDELNNIYNDAISKGVKKDDIIEVYNKKKEELSKGGEDTKDKILADIENEIKKSINDSDFKSYSDLPKELRDRIDKYKESHPGELEDVETKIFNKILQQVADSIIENEDYEIDDEGEDEVGDYNEGSQIREEMLQNRSVSFTSDYASLYIYSQDFAERYTPKSTHPRYKQVVAVQALLEKYKAYHFVDKNYLGYLNKEHLENDPEYHGLPIHFLRSTDPAIDHENAEHTIIFTAIEITNEDLDLLRKKAFNGAKGNVFEGELNLITIGDKQYQIVGALSYDEAESDQKVKDAFIDLQGAIQTELKGTIDSMSEDDRKTTPFVKSKLTSRIDTIFTGRLEKANDKNDKGEKVSLYDFLNTGQGSARRGPSTEWQNGSVFPFGINMGGSMDVSEGFSNLDIISPNSQWIEDHKGAIVMYVPKPDGSYYPVRLTRRTVTQWWNSKVDAERTGEQLLDEVLAGKNNNRYLSDIVALLKTVFDPDKSLGARIRAKMKLSKYFIFGPSSPIHIELNEVSLIFKTADGTYPIEAISNDEIAKTLSVEERIKNFFKVLSKNNVMFTLPAPSSIKIDGRSVVDSGIFEIGLRNFYNFNANFTVVPIDGKGLEVDTSGIPIEDRPGGGGGETYTQEDVDFDLGDGLKTYTYRSDGKVFLDGKEVSPDVQNLVNMAMKAEQKKMPLLVHELISGLNPKVKELLGPVIEQFSGVSIIHTSEGDWYYDSRVEDHNKRLGKMDSEYGENLKKEINNAIVKVTESKEALEVIKKERARKKGGKPADNNEGPAVIQMGPQEVDKNKPKGKPEPLDIGGGEPSNHPLVKELSKYSSASSDPLEVFIAGHKNIGFVKDRIYPALQQALKEGKVVDTNTVASKLKKAVGLKGEAKKNAVMSIIADDINGCKKE